MKNALLLLLTCCIYQKIIDAFHKESYYGDPYSMEYVGKYSTVNLTKEDILFADYVVEMLRNTSYTTIDFNASITYPLRFQHLYVSGVPTITTRRFATTSTRSPTKEKTWQYPENEYMFVTKDLWETPSSISLISRLTSSVRSSRLENRHYERLQSKNNITPSVCINLRKDKFENVRDIIKRNIITKTTKDKCTEKIHKLNEATEKIEALLKNHTSDGTTTRNRRSIPYFLNSDSGPWLTSKEQEQVWALRGTSLLDSEKYDFPFPYDFDKWPGCTTKDLTDPKNTIQVLEYENGHVRFVGVSKPGWNEFPWKPTDFTTAFPAYRRLDKYLTYLSRPWYGYYSTLFPTSLKKWDKKTTRAWSRFTFANLSLTLKHIAEKLKSSRKWMIDKWPPDWNQTLYPQTFASTVKRTRWGGKWILSLSTKRPSNANTETFHNSVSHAQKSKPKMKKPNLGPHKPPLTASLKSTTSFGFLSLSPTWYTYKNDLSNVSMFRPSNATWLSEWSRLWYEASKSAMSTKWPGVWNFTSDLSLMGQWSKEVLLPIYTYPKTQETKPWLEWPTRKFEKRSEKNASAIRPKTFYNSKLMPSQPQQWNREILNQWNKETPREWSTSSKLIRGGWSMPALTKARTKQLGSELSVRWSKTWYSKPYQQPYYSKQPPGGDWKWSSVWNKNIPFTANRPLHTKSHNQYAYQWNSGKEQQRAWSPQSRSSQFVRAPVWTNQWERQQPKTWSRSWYTKPYQYLSYSKQLGSGWSNQWNRVGSAAWSKTWYTKPFQYFSNRWNKESSSTWRWSRTWYTKPYEPRSNK